MIFNHLFGKKNKTKFGQPPVQSMKGRIMFSSVEIVFVNKNHQRRNNFFDISMQKRFLFTIKETLFVSNCGFYIQISIGQSKLIFNNKSEKFGRDIQKLIKK